MICACMAVAVSSTLQKMINFLIISEFEVINNFQTRNPEECEGNMRL